MEIYKLITSILCVVDWWKYDGFGHGLSWFLGEIFFGSLTFYNFIWSKKVDNLESFEQKKNLKIWPKKF